jgi:hypothetical protein
MATGFQGILQSLGSVFNNLTGSLRGGSSPKGVPRPTDLPASSYPSAPAGPYGKTGAYAPPVQIQQGPYNMPSAPLIPTNYMADANYAASQAAYDAQIRALQGEIDKLANPAPRALPQLPAFSVDDTYKRAREIATSNVSPYYESQLQQFRKEQELRRGRASEDFNTATTAIDTEMQNIKRANDLQQARTEEDVKQNIEEIVRSEAEAQLDSATGFNRAFNTLRGNQAQAGTLRSGIGQQQQAEGVADKRTAEGRVTAAADRQTKAQQLFKTRTFADIATSNELAVAEGGTRKKSAKVNLDRIIEDSINDAVTKEQQIAIEKQQTIEQQVAPAAQTLFNQFVSTLRDPEAVAYANEIYGGSF